MATAAEQPARHFTIARAGPGAPRATVSLEAQKPVDAQKLCLPSPCVGNFGLTGERSIHPNLAYNGVAADPPSRSSSHLMTALRGFVFAATAGIEGVLR